MDNENIIPESNQQTEPVVNPQTAPITPDNNESSVQTAPIAEPVAQPTAQTMCCSNCGEPYEIGSKFCTKCGTPTAGGASVQPNAYSAPQQPAFYAYSAPAVPVQPKKKIYKKWWFWLIIALFVGGTIIGGIIIADSSSSSSSGSSSYSYTYTNTYVRMVKDARHSSYGITYGDAFEDFFTNTSWRHFTSTTGEQVVEFEGDFYYDGSPATATVQFIVNVSEGTFTVYHLSINGVAQSNIVLSALISKVFESSLY